MGFFYKNRYGHDSCLWLACGVVKNNNNHRPLGTLTFLRKILDTNIAVGFVIVGEGVRSVGDGVEAALCGVGIFYHRERRGHRGV